MDQPRDFGSPVGIGLNHRRFASSSAKDDRDIGSHRPAANHHGVRTRGTEKVPRRTENLLLQRMSPSSMGLGGSLDGFNQFVKQIYWDKYPDF
jgi:hypothetical protein